MEYLPKQTLVLYSSLYHLNLRACCMKLKGGREGRNNILASSAHIECDSHPCVPMICFWERITLLSLEMTDPRKSSSLMSRCQQQTCNMKMWRENYHDLLLDDSYGVCASCQQMTLRETIIFVSNSRHSYL